jgi:isopentenyl-diphosphate Delta-isomerase
MPELSTITEQRKRDHLKPFREGGAPARSGSTWLECVRLIHSAMPNIGMDDLDLSTRYAGREFRVPLFITGMTGGTAEAGTINRSLARIASRVGTGFGLGSGRAMLENPDLVSTYQVRREAPEVFLAWNLGGVQLRTTPVARIKAAMELIEADAVCIHLNPAQELMQPEGDRDFSGVSEAIGRLIASLEYPVIVKETGAGISRPVGLSLRQVGVSHIDVAGHGGTSWVGVELMRQERQDDPNMGAFWDWGIPTAASLCELEDLGLDLIASGGIRSGLDAARAFALGAGMVGVAAPVLEGYFAKGERGAEEVLWSVIDGLKTAMILTGCRSLHDLKNSPRVLTGSLRDWVQERCGK